MVLYSAPWLQGGDGGGGLCFEHCAEGRSLLSFSIKASLTLINQDEVGRLNNEIQRTLAVKPSVLILSIPLS
jgi:hypothetical protein